MSEKFVSAPLRPVTATMDTSAMSIGGPGLPKEFVWRGQIIAVVSLLRSWRETGACRHGSGESYVRKHWFEVVTSSHGKLKIYFERQTRRSGQATWWLYSMSDG